MTDLTNFQKSYKSIDKAFATLILIFVFLSIWDLDVFTDTLSFMLKALLGTAPFILFAVLDNIFRQRALVADNAWTKS